ncbi:uncharacterized protein LOC110647761 isoform X1 [Hevea brasiliensis]|uniref:uncharacterized protein LOC110647761 isoform X1 n=1 Tax=Hevea brasiliensis TaxID=3981 RepID=UPI0025F6B821|nr:uncharacterized protein LOC110647761 isoform X1 [Hevea brasiliensis]
MGLSSFPCAAEGVLPVLVMNTVISVALFKNMVRSVLQVMGANWTPQDYEQDPDGRIIPQENARERRISITQFKSLTTPNSPSGSGGGSGGGSGRAGGATVECCVCLCGFEAEEEVSELSCKHFFHKKCLDRMDALVHRWIVVVISQPALIHLLNPNFLCSNLMNSSVTASTLSLHISLSPILTQTGSYHMIPPNCCDVWLDDGDDDSGKMTFSLTFALLIMDRLWNNYIF